MPPRPSSTQVREEFERRVQTGEFRLVENVGTEPHLTTAAMLNLEHGPSADRQRLFAFANEFSFDDAALRFGTCQV